MRSIAAALVLVPAVCAADAARLEDRFVLARAEGEAGAENRVRGSARAPVEIGAGVTFLPEARYEVLLAESLHAIEMGPGIVWALGRVRLFVLPRACLCTDFSASARPWSVQGVAGVEWRAFERLSLAVGAAYDVRPLPVAALRARPSSRWRLAIVFPLRATASFDATEDFQIVPLLADVRSFRFATSEGEMRTTTVTATAGARVRLAGLLWASARVGATLLDTREGADRHVVDRGPAPLAALGLEALADL